MKTITIKECHELKDKFENYCETAEQHEFPILAMVNLRLDATIAKIDGDGEVKNQKDARAMFRVILKIIGEDCSAYKENAGETELVKIEGRYMEWLRKYQQ